MDKLLFKRVRITQWPKRPRAHPCDGVKCIDGLFIFILFHLYLACKVSRKIKCTLNRLNVFIQKSTIMQKKMGLVLDCQ